MAFTGNFDTREWEEKRYGPGAHGMAPAGVVLPYQGGAIGLSEEYDWVYDPHLGGWFKKLRRKAKRGFRRGFRGISRTLRKGVAFASAGRMYKGSLTPKERKIAKKIGKGIAITGAIGAGVVFGPAVIAGMAKVAGVGAAKFGGVMTKLGALAKAGKIPQISANMAAKYVRGLGGINPKILQMPADKIADYVQNQWGTDVTRQPALRGQNDSQLRTEMATPEQAAGQWTKLSPGVKAELKNMIQMAVNRTPGTVAPKVQVIPVPKPVAPPAPPAPPPPPAPAMPGWLLPAGLGLGALMVLAMVMRR